MAVVDFSLITFTGIKAEIERYLNEEHNKAGILFSTASPYGHVLSVLENIHQMSLMYLKNSINQFDLSLPNSVNKRIIRNAAIYAGHNPGRAISSSGTLKLTMKSDAIAEDIPGSRITFSNKTRIKNDTNSLDYSLDLGTERMTHKITNNYVFYLPIIQGEWKQTSFTSNGEELQSFNISEKGSRDVENFHVEVYVNGEKWTNRNHIWEMIPDEKACVIRTGFNGGIDIIFGNGGFGKVPEIVEEISVIYLSTNGSAGNIFRRTRNDWSFVGDVIDGSGGVVQMDDIFDIDIYTDINFGADEEDLLFTKNILPISSNNFVLGLPQQYAYEIKKLGVFSHVNAYERSGTIFIVATPNIRLFKNRNADYFSIDIRAFELDAYEKSKINKYLKTSGHLQLTRKYRIDSPILSFYVMNVYVMTYSDALDDSVNAQIVDKVSEYFLDLRRIDRIPKLDIIKELSTIDDIHSVDIKFICKKNEDHHKEIMTDLDNMENNYNTQYRKDISTPKRKMDYDPNVSIGIDPVLGDIIFEADEIPIIRGGWYDRNDIFYSDDMDGNQLKSINIIKKGKIDSKNRPK